MIDIDKNGKTKMDKKNNKKVLVFTAAILTFGLFFGISESAMSENAAPAKTQNTTKTQVKKPAARTQKPQQPKAINTTALNIVNNPTKFLNKTVKMQATFDKFSTLGLDYSKALRPAAKYIGILIQREDVADHNIPLSEMKLFMKKEMAEKHIDLETGDKIEIIAKVFSNALGDPWLDIEQLSVIKKIKKEEEKTK